MLATVLEWLTDFLTGAIMESRKAAISKAVASPPPDSYHLHKKPSLTQAQYVPDNKSDCGWFTGGNSDRIFDVIRTT